MECKKEYIIAVAIILYNPERELLSSIKIIYDQVGRIFLIDNSDIPNSILVSKLKSQNKIKYISNGNNLGMGKALNIAAQRALSENFDLMLMMDQDSVAEQDMIEKLTFPFLNDNFDKIGIISATPIYEGYKKKETSFKTQVLTTITSGSLLNLRAYEKVGQFKSDFFIDYVDFEFCLRLNKYNYKVIKVKNAKFKHKLGHLTPRNFLFKKVAITNHSPLRLYYRTRNRLWVNKEYFKYFPKYVFKDMIIFFNEVIKILLFENNKVEKIKMIIRGFSDFLKNKFGQYQGQ